MLGSGVGRQIAFCAPEPGAPNDGEFMIMKMRIAAAIAAAAVFLSAGAAAAQNWQGEPTYETGHFASREAVIEAAVRDLQQRRVETAEIKELRRLLEESFMALVM